MTDRNQIQEMFEKPMPELALIFGGSRPTPETAQMIFQARAIAEASDKALGETRRIATWTVVIAVGTWALVIVDLIFRLTGT